jgi:hypothetical protein
MVLPDGRPKGLKTILTERGKWPRDRSLDSARVALSICDDFEQQREWLEETVTDAGHLIDYYPKFHCELNYIEMVWAYSKAQLRRRCTYNFKDMRTALPENLYSVPISFHRRALRHCLRFMSGYRQGLQGPLLDYVLKKYKGHREIPAFVGRELENLEIDFNRQRDAKIIAKLNSCN